MPNPAPSAVKPGAAGEDRAFEPPPWADAAHHRARALLIGCLHPQQTEARAQAKLAAWPEHEITALVACANFHGLTPLLALHARAHGTAALRRALAPHAARAAHTARVRGAVLAEVLHACQKRGVQVLLLKGAALAYTAYPDAALRPMRDIDLMAAPGQTALLSEVLAAMGFADAGVAVPQGHHHLPPQILVREHVTVFVEPHTDLGLSPRINIAPEALFAAARPADMAGAPALIPGIEHMLWHVYRHGFTMPFTTEATKLIWCVDLHVWSEAWCEHPHFAAALRARPRLRRILAALHAAIPWSAQVQRALAPAALATFRQLADYSGWPRAALTGPGSPRGNARLQALQATLLPPDFWLAMRQGARPGPLARAVMYARHWRDLAQKIKR